MTAAFRTAGDAIAAPVMLARRNVKSKELAEYIGITEANLSLLRQGKVKGIRFNTLDAICRYLDCQPGDILAFEPDDETTVPPTSGAIAGGGA